MEIFAQKNAVAKIAKIVSIYSKKMKNKIKPVVIAKKVNVLRDIVTVSKNI